MMGNDATSIEMAIGASHFSRTILAETFNSIGIAKKRRRQVAADLLHNNAVRMYGIGKEFDSSE